MVWENGGQDAGAGSRGVFARKTSWTPSKKKWRALGMDPDVPRRDPARNTFSDTVQVDIID